MITNFFASRRTSVTNAAIAHVESTMTFSPINPFQYASKFFFHLTQNNTSSCVIDQRTQNYPSSVLDEEKKERKLFSGEKALNHRWKTRFDRFPELVIGPTEPMTSIGELVTSFHPLPVSRKYAHAHKSVEANEKSALPEMGGNMGRSEFYRRDRRTNTKKFFFFTSTETAYFLFCCYVRSRNSLNDNVTYDAQSKEKLRLINPVAQPVAGPKQKSRDDRKTGSRRLDKPRQVLS